MSVGQTIAGALFNARLALSRDAREAGDVSERPDEKRKERIEALVREHHAFVWRSVRRLGVREADLDDAVQEVFLVAAKDLDAITTGRERGYFFRTAVFVAAHAKRRAVRRREVAVDDERLAEEVDRAETPEQHVASAQARARVNEILDAMPEDNRTAFILFEIEQMTMSEIAEALSWPPGTVASRLRRAREIFMAHPLAIAAMRER